MPIKIIKTDGHLGHIICGEGIVTNEDLRLSVRDQLTRPQPSFGKYIYSISDYTNISNIEVNSDFIHDIAQECINAAVVNPNLTVAIAASTDIAFGLSRMWELMSNRSPWEIKVFRCRQEAEEWTRQTICEKFGMVGLTFS